MEHYNTTTAIIGVEIGLILRELSGFNSENNVFNNDFVLDIGES